MTKTFAEPPRTIPLNAIDRSYLIPETADINGSYFPMSPLGVITLKRTLDPGSVAEALRLLDTHIPQLRLAYTLDLQHSRWQRVPDPQREAYFDTLVTCSADPAASLETILSETICTNIEPFQQPLSIILHGKHFIIRLNHSFADGMLGAVILKAVLAALAGPEHLNALPKFERYHGLSLWRLIAQSPKRIVQVSKGWFQSLRSYYPSAETDLLSEWHNPDRKPVMCGSPMAVRLYTIEAEAVTQLKHLKANFSQDGAVSMNTLLQVLLAHRLHALGYLGQRVTYSIPVDLHRYMDHAAEYYPGNLSSQIRVKVTEHPLTDIAAHCHTVEAEVQTQLENAAPLVNLPYEWLMRLAGRRTYNRLNREWLLASIHTDPRLFVLSNLGNLTRAFRDFDNLIDFDAGLYSIGPLMGGPPLISTFNIVGKRGHVAVTYDPQIFSQDQIDEIFALFQTDWLEILHKKPEEVF